MTRSRRRYRPNTLFSIAIDSGEAIEEIINSARKVGEPSTGRRDKRLAGTEAQLQANGILAVIEAINPSLPLLAIEWIKDPNLKKQIETGAEPIMFPPLETSAGFTIAQYAGMLAITATAKEVYTEGWFDDLPIWARPKDTTDLVIRRYHADAGPLEQSQSWQDHHAQK